MPLFHEGGDLVPRQVDAALGHLVLFTDHMDREDGHDTPITSSDYEGVGLVEGRDSLMSQADYDSQRGPGAAAGRRLESRVVHYHPGYAAQTAQPSFPVGGVLYVEREDPDAAGKTEAERVFLGWIKQYLLI